MPLYEYVCAACQEPFERYVRSWSDEVACPACASPDVAKQLSTFAFASGEGGLAAPAGGGGGCCAGGGCSCRH